MEETLKKLNNLDKIQFPSGNFCVRLTPELLNLLITKQKELFPDYEIVLKWQDNKGERDISVLEVNKGLSMKPETVKILEDYIFLNKFNEVIK